MDFGYSPRTQELQQRLSAFMAEHVYPAEARHVDELRANTAAGKRWTPLQVIESLKPKARQAGLWNLFLPDSALGAGLSNQEYAPLAEIMGRVPWASEVFNCSAPDTGNMEVLVRYGSSEQKAQWLTPLLAGEIRIGLQLAQEDLAQLLGASRQRVNQELKGFERQGAVRVEPTRLVVLSRDKLLAIAKG